MGRFDHPSKPLAGRWSAVLDRLVGSSAVEHGDGLFHAVAEDSGLPVATKRADGWVEYANEPYRRLIGGAGAEAPFDEAALLPAEMAEGLRRRDRAALADGASRQDDEAFPDGRVALLTRVPLGEDRLLVLGLDISERSRQEKGVLESRTLFQGILDIANDGVVSIDENQAIILYNQGAERIFGYSAAEILGRPLDTLIPARFHAVHRGHLKAFSRSETVARQMGDRGTIYGRRRDGSDFPCEASISHLSLGGRQIFTAILRDITAVRAAEAAIQQLNADLSNRAIQLENANRELEAFSYSVSHDLRAPLRGIDGFSQVLLEDYGDKLDAEAQDYLRRVRAASQQMAQLIDDILDLSRLTRGEIRRQSVDLSAEARQVAADLAATEPGRQVIFVVADGAFAHADPHLTKVVLTNLLGNAWKYTSRHPAARIEFGVADEPTGRRVFFVKDDGAGFDMAYVDKLFGAFQRLHGVKDFAGSGVGLATVQRIVHKHGGEVWAHAAVERGATFFFTLP